MKNFWDRVKHILELEDVTLKEITSDCHFHQAIFCESKKYHMPNTLTVTKIALYLNTSVEFLLNGYTEDSKPFLVDFKDQYTLDFENLPLNLKKNIISITKLLDKKYTKKNK